MKHYNLASWKRTMIGLNCIFYFVVMIFLIPVSALAQQKPVGKIIGITGAVKILIGEPVAQVKKGEFQKVSAEVWKTVKNKQPVYAKDTFKTGRKSRLKILFEDKSLMALGPKTRMSIESYIFKPEDKLRQGVINVAHGLSMYIVNKSQKNKKSSFRIVSPTGNLAARGTQGYISATPDKTLIANQAGTVVVRNIDPHVGMERKSNWFEESHEPVFTTASYEEIDSFAQFSGGNEIPMGPMTKSTILQGLPPTPPVPLTPGELNSIRNVVLAKIGVSAQNKKLMKVEEKKSKKKKKKKQKNDKDSSKSETSGTSDSTETDEAGDSEESADSEELAGSEEMGDSEEAAGSEEMGGSEEAAGSEEMGGFQDVTGGGETGGDIEIDSGFMSDFVEGVVPQGSFGGSDDFAGNIDVFDDSGTESCSQ